MGKFKRLSAVMALVFLLTTLLGGISIYAEEDQGNRIYGNDRFETAKKIAEEGWPDGSQFVVLVRGEANPDESLTNAYFADAAVGASLAKAKNAPILLTKKDRIPDATKEALKALNPTFIYIIGGEGVISAKVEDELKKDYLVRRLGGANRYETAAKVAEELYVLNPFKKAVVVPAFKFEEAVAVASYAANEGMPILFTPSGQLNNVTADCVRKLRVKEVKIIGDENAVAEDVKEAIEAMNLNVERIKGEDKYDLAVKVAEAFKPTGGYDGFVLVRGDDCADAMSVAPWAAGKKAVLFIDKDASEAPATVKNFVRANAVDKGSKVVAVGGPAVVPVKVANDIVKNSVRGTISDDSGSSSQNGDTIAFEEVNFDDGEIPPFVTTRDATMEIVDNSTGSKALKVNYNVADFPTVIFKADKPWDFGEKSALSFEVTNPTDEVITFYLRIDDDPTADGVKHSTVTTIVVQPQKTETFFFSLSSEVLDYGMRYLPVTKAGKQLGYSWGEKDLNEHNIVKFEFWLMYPNKEYSLIFDNIKVVPDPNADLSAMDDLVDEYGQYTGLEWEGKVTRDEDLVAARIAEEEALNASEPPLKTSKYGGWADGPRLEATGRFYVTKYNDKWTLVDPEGYLFFATGVCCVRLDDLYTWVTGRENMFKSLPSREGPLGDHYLYTTYSARPPLGLTEGWLFNFYSANLERKYGQDYLNEWKNITLKRFKNWGFSTLGNWSDPQLFYGKGDETKIAYVVHGWIRGNHATIPSGHSYWAPVPDPFDPEFVNSVNKMIDEQILQYGVANDEWCLGVFVDNEIAWGNPANTQDKYALITNILAMDASEPTSYAKRAMISFLKEKYNNNIEALNEVWGTTLKSFEELEAPFRPESITEGMIPDYSEMLHMLADKYYSVVDAALDEKLPGVLYLGSRFAEWGAPLEVIKAAAKYVDVMSFNVYKESVEGQAWMHLDKFDKPVIVGEFHFGSTDRGMFGGGLVNAKDQEDRGRKYIHYMATVAKDPHFVGAHWFDYVDQPLLGRAWDGENYNIGFVDVTDTPYQKLVDAAKLVHGKLFDIRYNGYDIEEDINDQVMVENKYSFEDGEDISMFKVYKEATMEIVSEGATDGSKALRVNVGTLDSDYSGVNIRPTAPWNMGTKPKITMDVTNPCEKDIQLRCNVFDGNGAVRTFYFGVAAGETRTITIEKLGPSADNWGYDGYWGANDGLDTSNITLIQLYLWEDNPNGSGDAFIIDNLGIAVVE